MKNKMLLGLVIAIVFMLSMTFMVSAIDVKYSDSYLPKDKSISVGVTSGNLNQIKELVNDKNNNKEKDMIKSKYPKIEISDDKFLGLFGGGKLLDLELIDHTEYCTIDCYSILKVDLYKKSSIIDDIKTRNEKLQYTNDIDVKIYISKNVSRTTTEKDLVKQCKMVNVDFTISKGVNNVLISEEIVPKQYEECTYEDIGKTKEVTTYSEEFVEYNNEELEPGTYIVKITGKKGFNQVIDWVPTIKNNDITELAWWNITDVYGNGSLGDVYFSTTTKTYGNMVNGVDYTVGGNTLYLMTDRAYQFNSFYLGSGTTLSTNNVTGAAFYIMAKTNMTVLGTIDLSSRLNPGQYNATSFSYLGDSFTTPSVANGGSALIGGSQGGGFGGGGTSGNGVIAGCSVTSGTGGAGGYPFGPAGGGSSATSTNDNCVQSTPGAAGSRSGGAGGPTSSFDQGGGGYYGCTISSTGGAGGGSYGAAGGGGSSSGSHVSSWNCFSGSVGDGGGGSGGSAGRPGLNLVLRAENLTLLGSSNTILVRGTSGTNGGNGGANAYGTWVSNSWSVRATGCGAYGGGGGGGASAGNVKIYYRYLTNSTSLSSIINQTAGSGGTGGYNSPYAPDCSTYQSNSGGAGSAGTLTLYQEGFVTITDMIPVDNSPVVIPPIMTFSATINPTLSTLVNATFYLWNNGTLNNTQNTVLSGTNSVNVSWNRTSAEVPDGSYAWGIRVCYTDGTTSKCINSQNNTFTTFSVQFGNSSYNAQQYEMTNQTYSINVTSTGFVNLSGSLIWNGVSYPATTTGNNVNATFTRSIWIPTGVGNKTFYWDISYGGQSKVSPSQNVTILNSYYSYCNTTNNVTFFTINYRDETTNLPINATIVQSTWDYNITDSPYGEQYIYSSPLINGSQQTSLNHNFCFTPPYSSILLTNGDYQYGNPNLGYSTKIWNWQSLPLSNTTSSVTLYLINLIDSGTSPVTFQAISAQTNVVIEGVRVQVYRTISGTSTLVDDGYTDTAGTISYYMSPITSYTIVASGGGCNQLTSTITPTSGQYNLILDCENEAAQEFSSLIDGITFTRTPADGINRPGTETYTFNVYNSKSNQTLQRVKFQLVDAKTRNVLIVNDSLANTAGCNATSCGLSLVYTTFTGDNIKGMYYVSVTNTNESSLVLIEGDAYWRFIKINQNNSVNAVGRLMLNLQDFFGTWGTATVDCGVYTSEVVCEADPQCKWVNETVWAPKESEDYATEFNACIPGDDYNKQEFNRIFVIFFILVIVLFILGRTTGYELNHPGAFVVGMSAIIWILSLYGMFTFNGLTQYPFFNQYIFALITSCIGAGYGISVIRRYSG